MKILFLVTAFYPEQAIGAVRITKVVKFAVRAGHDVTVVSLPPPPWAMRDETLRFRELDTIRWTSIPQSDFFCRFFQRARVAAVGNRSALETDESGRARSLRSRCRSAAQFLYTLLKAIDWTIQIRRYARHSLFGERFDAIFTSYPSFASPFAGVMLKCMNRSRCLMIDFRDPVTYGRTRPWSARRWIERWLLGHARFVSFASVGVQTKVVGAIRGILPTQRVVPNGFDPDDVLALEPIDVDDATGRMLHFAYVGSLYGGKRDLSPFFGALAEAVGRSANPVHRFVIHYAGLEGDIFRSQADRHGLGTHVRDHGRISRRCALGLLRAVDICLVSTWNTPDDQGILTGKVFEFFMLRKPVLAVVNGSLPNSELRRIISETGAGFCYEEAASGEMPAFVEWLRARLREKAETGRVDVRYTTRVSDYDFHQLCDGLFESIAQVLR
ncbi:MAG: hypothetical protein ACKOCN_00965 [Planctomycetaceae bacterium]